MFAWTDHAAEQVSKSFSQCVLQHRLVQAQVRNKLLQPPHLVLEMLQPAHLRNAQTAELLLPPVERLFGDLQLPADLLHRHAALDLPQRKRNLLFRESLPFHR